MLTAGTLEAFGLYLVRTSALVLGAPLLGTGASFAGYKIALIGAVSVVLYLATGTPLDGTEPAMYGLFVLREVALGIFLAFVLHGVILAVRVSAELLGHQMGFAMSSVVDPEQGVRIPLLGQMYEIFFLLGLLAVDGHHWLFRALAESFGRAPVGRLPIEEGMTPVAVDLFPDMFTAGLTFAAPVFVLLALVSILLGLLSRAVPQLNMMEFGFNLRIAVGLLAMLAFAPLLGSAMHVLLGQFMDGLGRGLDALGA